MEKKKILITGATGFLGTNLQQALGNRYEIYAYNSKSQLQELDRYAEDCDFVFHFAAIHRPKDVAEFSVVNTDLFGYLLEKLEQCGNNCPVLYTSSIQAVDDTPYGRSKTGAEELLRQHSRKLGSSGMVYRLTNTFGPHARPNGHSVVATFCYNLNRDLPIQINNPTHQMRLYYVGDVMDLFLQELQTPAKGFAFRELEEDKVYPVTLQQLADKLYAFREADKKEEKLQPEAAFDQKLYKTFQSYREK